MNVLVLNAGSATLKFQLVRTDPDRMTAGADEKLARFAAVAHLSLEEFRRRFEYLVEDEPPPLEFAGLPKHVS